MYEWLFHPVKDSKPYWLELLPPLITVILAIFGYWWALKVWKKQKSIESRIASSQQREASRISSCKAVWALLAYMSEKENSKTVFVKRGKTDKVTWNLRKDQATDYLKQIEEVFFAQGHGIFMPKDIRDDIYEFRSRIYRLLEKELQDQNATSLIIVNNPDVIKKVEELRTRLNERLREEINRTVLIDF